MWDATVPGFGVRVTDRADAKRRAASISFIVMRRLPGQKQPIRHTIGRYHPDHPKALPLAKARDEARRVVGLNLGGTSPKEQQRRREEEQRAARQQPRPRARRSTPQITNPGGLWDESQNFYPRLGGIPHVGMREWRWPRAGRIKFSHLQFDSTVYDWQGAQIALICFDELTHFTAHQFFYMVSCNRSTCGVRPYIRATCNPDADSWVADFLTWWINLETGLPIPERAGVLRYYVRVAEKTIWADRPEELVQYLPQPEDLPPSTEPPRPISVTVIPATVFNNPILLRGNPEYYAWLLSLPTLERERLLGGNWKIRPAAGLYFQREWCAIVDAVPADLDIVRYWDLAATEKTERNDPDWTVGIKLGRDRSGGYYLLDLVRARANPGDVEQLLRNTAE